MNSKARDLLRWKRRRARNIQARNQALKSPKTIEKESKKRKRRNVKV